jgi:hypothetical protein
MKTLNLIKFATIVLILSVLTIQASPVNKGPVKHFKTQSVTSDPISIPTDPTMLTSTDGTNLFIMFQNPGAEEVTFTISDIQENILQTYTVFDVSGTISIPNQQLIALGGNGNYIVSMYVGHPKKKVETSTVIILMD